MVAPHRLTPETLLSLPRPGAAVPNPSGTAYIQPYTSFDFGSGRTSRAVAVGSLKKASSADNGKGKHDHSPVVDILQDLRYSDVAWLDDDTLVYLRPRGAQAGHADVDVSLSDKAFAAKLAKEKQAGDAETAEEGQELWCKTLSGDSYRIGEVPVEITDLKTARSSPDGALLAFSAEVYPEDPSLHAVARLDKEYEDKKNGADVMVFDKLYIRHWDTWTTEKRKLVFYLELKKGSDGNSAAAAPANDDSFDVHSLSSTDDEDESAHRDAKHAWSIVGTPSSPLAGFEPSAIECPVRPFGDSSDFDLTASHFAFVSKDPHLPEAWHTRMHVYLVPLRPRSEDEKKPRCLTSQGGARSSPVFSSLAKSGSRGKGKLAWLEMRKDGYEADRNRIIVYDLEKDVKFGISESWELSPGSIAWSEDDSVLFVTAEDEGHKKLFEFRVPEVPSSSSSSPEALKQVAVKPRALTSAHNVSSFHVLPTIYAKAGKHTPNANLLLTMNSLVSPNEAYLLSTSSHEDGSDTRSLDRISNITTDLVSGLSMDQGEEFWFTGADPERQVHGFLLRPHGYDSLAVAEKKEKYGLAFLVHGGPQGAWTDSWSTRWNPNVWAAQGYVVVAINPTGSTGYGQDFTDAINKEWGGKPYKDLVAGLDFVKRVYADLIDTDRMVMLGASYGGYMANWMQGHNDALGFAAIVCHDGILNTTATWFSTEEIYFPEHDLGGTPWEVPNEYAKWSPHNHIGNWRTPQLIIHGGKDYRLPETEGIGVFNALQRRGVPSKLVYFPKENHWVMNAYNSRRWHEEIFSWMEEWAPSGPR